MEGVGRRILWDVVAIVAGDDEPLPRTHSAHAAHRGDAGANVEPLSRAPSVATIGVRSSYGNRIANAACRGTGTTTHRRREPTGGRCLRAFNAPKPRAAVC